MRICKICGQSKTIKGRTPLSGFICSDCKIKPAESTKTESKIEKPIEVKIIDPVAQPTVAPSV